MRRSVVGWMAGGGAAVALLALAGVLVTRAGATVSEVRVEYHDAAHAPPHDDSYLVAGRFERDALSLSVAIASFEQELPLDTSAKARAGVTVTGEACAEWRALAERTRPRPLTQEESLRAGGDEFVVTIVDGFGRASRGFVENREDWERLARRAIRDCGLEPAVHGKRGPAVSSTSGSVSGYRDRLFLLYAASQADDADLRREIQGRFGLVDGRGMPDIERLQLYDGALTKYRQEHAEEWERFVRENQGAWRKYVLEHR